MQRAVATALFLGICLGCGAPAPQKPPAAEPGLENGSFTADLGGVRVHYEVHGRGPVLMTLPNSWGLSLEGLRALYRPLEERLTLVYFDPRGMGGSGPVREDADMGMAAVRADFDALRRHLRLDKVDVIGWSNGASNLILLAAEHPEAIDSAIFLSGVASFGPEDMAAWQKDHPEMIQLYASLQKEMSDPSRSPEEKTARVKQVWLGQLFPLSCADRVACPELLERTFGAAQFSWPHVEYANKEAPTFDARDKLALIRARSLVIAGAHDSFPPAKARELHDGLADSSFIVFNHSGHFSPVEEPDAFKSAIFQFLGVVGGTS